MFASDTDYIFLPGTLYKKKYARINKYSYEQSLCTHAKSRFFNQCQYP